MLASSSFKVVVEWPAAYVLPANCPPPPEALFWRRSDLFMLRWTTKGPDGRAWYGSLRTIIAMLDHKWTKRHIDIAGFDPETRSWPMIEAPDEDAEARVQEIARAFDEWRDESGWDELDRSDPRVPLRSYAVPW